MFNSDIHAWPYPDVDNRWNAGDKTTWREVDEHIYWEQLECLYPAKMSQGAFAVGEPYDHDINGAVHTVFVELSERYFCKMDNLKNFSPIKYKLEIRDQMNK
jgi:hypothetical protein